MYNNEDIWMEHVLYEDQFELFYDAFKDTDQSYSAFVTGASEEEIKRIIARADVFFFNVYYEKMLIGYILLELRSTRTADFHWGVIKKSKYLPRIIEDVFKQCCKMEIDNFIGWTPSENKLALKVAKNMGFEKLNEIPCYYKNGEAVTLSIYKNKR